jgi:integrase
MIVTLHYHRRHGRDCEGKHPAGTYTSEAEERKKGWTRCKCPIYASGSLDRVHRRLATKQTDWAAAAALLVPYIARNTWDDPEPEPPAPPPPPGALTPEELAPPEGAKGVTVPEAVKAYLAWHTENKSSEATIRGHRYSTNRIVELSRRRGVIRLEEWTRDMVRQLRSEAGGGKGVEPDTARTYLNRTKAFFFYCVNLKRWIPENPAKLPREVPNNRVNRLIGHKQKHPFGDGELVRMYEACKTYGHDVPSGTRVWTGEDLADFIAVSVHTGLRISDVANFHIERLKGTDEVHVRTTKAGSMVYSAVPLWLAERIRARAETIGPFIFGEHTSTIVSVTTGEWRNRLYKLWETCGPWEHKATPHRFRHTFARILLEDGNSPSDVAELMGNTEKVVREYYAAWLPGRQERTSERLRRAFREVPTPFSVPRRDQKVVEIRHG